MPKYVSARIPDLSAFTPQDLMALGKDQVGYLRRYRMDGESVIVLHAADGAAIAVQKDARAARDSARRWKLDIVTVH